MLIQLVNVFGGFVLALPVFKKFPNLEAPLAKVSLQLEPHKNLIGIGQLTLGALNLVSLWGASIYLVNGGYTQSLAALVAGLLLAQSSFRDSESVMKVIANLKPYEGYIGIAAMVVGLYAIV